MTGRPSFADNEDAINYLPRILGFTVLASSVAGLIFLGNAQTTSSNAAENFLSTLSAAEREKLVLPFDSDRRTEWNYVPGQRPGLSLKELGTSQRTAALAMLRAALSEAGYRKVESIRTDIEPVLRELEGGNRGRDLELYYVTFFGSQSADAPWGWRYEGHHLSLNFTYRGGKIVATTPQFLGSNPAEVREGPHKGLRVLAKEEDLGRELLLSLDPDQRKEAVLGDRAPSDMITSNQRKAAIEGKLGLPYSRMSEPQKKLLRALVEEYANVQKPDQAGVRLAKIEKSGWEWVCFAWMGSAERGQGHYYRIQGETFLIEYDNTQNRANHIHSVWRDFDGDFGRDVLGEHYEGSTHHRTASAP